MKRPTPTPPARQLACLGGRPPSEELLADLRKICALPDAAKLHFWELLGPCLGEENPADLGERVARFCSAYGAPAPDLGDAIGAARCLIRGAAAFDLEAAAFAEDLSRVPGDHDLATILVPGYDDGKAVVRAEISRESIADHGKVLTGVDYRVDVATSSSRAVKLGVPVVLLTLRYGRGKRQGRVTVQASLDRLRELHDACGRILEESARAPRSGDPAPDLTSE